MTFTTVCWGWLGKKISLSLPTWEHVMSFRHVHQGAPDEEKKKNKRVDRVKKNKLLFELQVHEEECDEKRFDGGDHDGDDGIHFAEIYPACRNGYDREHQKRTKHLIEDGDIDNVTESLVCVFSPQ